MAIKCEAIVPEIEVTFPAVMENRTIESRTLIINEDIGIDDRKGVIDLRKHNFLFDPCPPGSKFVMKITAEDGREWPRMGRYAMRESVAYWLHLEGPGGWRSLKIKDIDSHEVQTPVGEIADTGGTLQPFPSGTITTITFVDGEWSCEVEEPVERKEVAMGDVARRLGSGENLTMIHAGRARQINKHSCYTFRVLSESKFYELPTEPQLTPEPAAEKEPDWLPVALNGFGGHGMQIRRADPSRAHVVINEVIVLDSQGARQLSDIAARFADEQEFPGEALPMKWTDEDMDLPPSRIDSDGHLELEKEWIRSEYEADRLMRAIRLYKRHLQEQAKA